jgi:large subunit ribosomal protein L12
LYWSAFTVGVEWSIYAVMLLHSAGKEITEERVMEIMRSAGLEPDHGRIKSLVSTLAEVDIEEAMQTPVLAGAPVSAAAAPAAEEEEEEEDLQGLGALFGPEPPG